MPSDQVPFAHDISLTAPNTSSLSPDVRLALRTLKAELEAAGIRNMSIMLKDDEMVVTYRRTVIIEGCDVL
jgi:hypothetical protein